MASVLFFRTISPVFDKVARLKWESGKSPRSDWTKRTRGKTLWFKSCWFMCSWSLTHPFLYIWISPNSAYVASLRTAHFELKMRKEIPFPRADLPLPNGRVSLLPLARKSKKSKKLRCWWLVTNEPAFASYRMLRRSPKKPGREQELKLKLLWLWVEPLRIVILIQDKCFSSPYSLSHLSYRRDFHVD